MGEWVVKGNLAWCHRGVLGEQTWRCIVGCNESFPGIDVCVCLCVRSLRTRYVTSCVDLQKSRAVFGRASFKCGSHKCGYSTSAKTYVRVR